MTRPEFIAELLKQCLEDPNKEAALLRALLDAEVYVHVPRLDRDERVRIVQFDRPDGLTVLPFFSDRVEAEAASGSSAKILAITGRQLFEATRGAILMLNPNSIQGTIYPEEITALLDRNEVSLIEKTRSGDDTRISAPQSELRWLTEALKEILVKLDFVRSAYLAQLCEADGTPSSWLVVVETPDAQAEHMARAVTTMLQPLCLERDTFVDLQTFPPEEPHSYLAELGLSPFYQRRVLD